MFEEIDIQILKELSKDGPISTKELTERLGRKRTTINYRLDALLDLNIIKRIKSGRNSEYLLTEKANVDQVFQDEIEKLSKLQTQINEIVTKTQKSNEKLKLAFVNYYDLLPEYKKSLEEYYEIQDFSDKELFISYDEFLFRARDADVVVNNAGCNVRKEEISKLNKLKYLHVSTSMYRYVDTDALKSSGIHFSNLPDYRLSSISEFALAQTFALLRNVRGSSAQLQSGVTHFKYFKGELLRGKVVGILGTDEISLDLYRLLKNLGTEVLLYTENVEDDPNMMGVSRFYSIKEIFEKAEIIYSVDSSDNLLNATKKLDNSLLDNITNPIHLISLSKHQYIDYDLLRKLLYEGKIKGLGLEVGFLGENLHEERNKIMYIPNVFIAPDVAWYTSDSVEKLNRLTNRALISYAQGINKYLLF